MRIAVANWTARKAGGVEAYLDDVIPALAEAGHDVVFWHEMDVPDSRSHISLPEGVPRWSAAEMGTDAALDVLRLWRPDLLYVHGIVDPHVEAALQAIAPSVIFAHAYQGTCISGSKTNRLPVPKPCGRRFGWRCLMHYYPRRCGGLNPQTMWLDYRRQSERLDRLRKYAAVVTHSAHMRQEFLHHGLESQRVIALPFYVYGSDGRLPSSRPHELPAHGRRLLFIGRMDTLKGGATLLEALPHARRQLGFPLHLVFAGDGPERDAWMRSALQVQAADPGVSVEFTGWVEATRRESLFREADLLVVPSIWPEPFGRVGPEAGFHSLPVAAFDVGGVRDWLTAGENGYIAPGDPPTAEGLASAIVQSLRNDEEYERLRAGALRLAQRFSGERHMEGFMKVFGDVARRPRL